MKNTDSSTWMSGGSYPFRLGTRNPRATTPDYFIYVGQVAPVVSSLTVSPKPVASGRTVAMTAALSATADLSVTLTSSNSFALTPPCTITVPANSSSSTDQLTVAPAVAE